MRARSSTGTRAKPATAIREDQATRVPPPDQMLPICPIAASVVGSIPTAGPSAPDSEPVSGRPLNPDPSRPAINADEQDAERGDEGFGGRCDCAALTRSNRKAGPAASSGSPRMAAGEVAVADEEEAGDRQHDAHRLEREHQAVDDMLGRRVQEVALVVGRRRSEQDQRRDTTDDAPRRRHPSAAGRGW